MFETMPNPRLALLLLLVARLDAGVIQGVVLEYQSGRPLARTIVRLQPIPGSPNDARPQQVRATSSGSFAFAGVPPGMYIVMAQRAGFFDVRAKASHRARYAGPRNNGFQPFRRIAHAAYGRDYRTRAG
jgi:hypothetical protein